MLAKMLRGGRQENATLVLGRTTNAPYALIRVLPSARTKPAPPARRTLPSGSAETAAANLSSTRSAASCAAAPQASAHSQRAPRTRERILEAWMSFAKLCHVCFPYSGLVNLNMGVGVVNLGAASPFSSLTSIRLSSPTDASDTEKGSLLSGDAYPLQRRGVCSRVPVGVRAPARPRRRAEHQCCCACCAAAEPLLCELNSTG